MRSDEELDNEIFEYIVNATIENGDSWIEKVDVVFK
jgi:hypothetical protein